MRTRWYKSVCAVALIAMSLAACGGNDDTAGQDGGESEETEETEDSDAASDADDGGGSQEVAGVIKIGAAVSTSGSLASLGERVEDGYRFWADTVNGAGGIDVGGETYNVELVIYDDESDPTTAARLAQRLITEDDVDFIFGPFGSTATLTVGEVVNRSDDVVLVQCCGSADAIYEQGFESLFGILAPASTHPTFFVDMAVEEGAQTMGILSLDDVFPGLQRGALLELGESADGPDIVFDEVYSAEQTNFSTILQGLSNADPDIVLVLGYTEDAVAIVRDMQGLQYHPDGIFFSGPALAELYESLGDDINYGFGATFWHPTFEWSGPTFGTAQEFADAFLEATGSATTHQEALAAAAGEVLHAAIEQAGTIDKADVVEALNTGSFETTGAGVVEYDETGINIGGAVGVSQLLDGVDTIVYVAGQPISSELVFPVPGWNERTE